VEKNRRRHETLHCNSQTATLIGYYGFEELKIFVNVITKIAEFRPNI
jgi:hypothetical protein